MGMNMIARPNFGKPDPGVPFEVGGDDDVLVGDDASGRNIELFRDFKNDFRLANGPSVYPMDRLRRVVGIARRSAPVRPCGDSLNLGIRKAAIVREVADGGIGKPGWHLARLDHLCDGASHVWSGRNRAKALDLARRAGGRPGIAAAGSAELPYKTLAVRSA